MTPDALERSLAACSLSGGTRGPFLPSHSNPPTEEGHDAAAASASFARATSRSLSSSLALSSSALGAGGGGYDEPLLSSLTLGSTGLSATATADDDATAAAIPPRLVSIQEIRHARRAGTATATAAAAPTTHMSPPPSSLSLSSSAPGGVAALAAQLHHQASAATTTTTTMTRARARPLVQPAEVLGGCRFLHARPEDMRLSDVGALLEEYRALAALAAELAGLSAGGGEREI
jgi:hypothetical protein